MSGFSAGANAFLSHPAKDKLFAPNPATERGAGCNINAHKTEPLVIYPSGKFIVVRNILDPGASFVYRGHSAPTTVAKFSPNGFWVASADTSGKVRVWSWDNPEHLTKLETGVFAGSISDLDWDSESKKLVVAGDGSGLLVKCITWDTGNSAGEMHGHNKKVLSVAYRPCRPFRVMSASEDMKTAFYAGPPFKLDHSMAAHTNFVNCVRYSPDGERVVSVSSDRKIQLYDGKTGEQNGDIPDAHTGGIYSVSWSPDSTQFLTASADKTVKLWNAATLALETTFTFSEDPQLGDAQVGVVWAAEFMLSVSLNGNMNILKKDTPSSPEKVLQSHQVAVSALSVNRASQTLYTGSCDGVICVRKPDGLGEATRLLGTNKKHMSGAAHNGQVVGLAVVTGDVVSLGWDDKMRLSHRTTHAEHAEVALPGQPCALANSTPGTDLLVVVTNAEVCLYRGEQKVGGIDSAALGFQPTCAALLNEDEVAIGGADFKTHIFALNNLSFVAGAIIETRSAVSALAYNPAGDMLAIGDNGRQVEVYERASWTAVVKGKWVFHTSKVTCLSWSPRGTQLASGSLDENIFVWNLAKPMSKLHLPFTHMGGVTGLGWMDDCKLVSGGNDNTVVTWNIPPAEA